MVAGLSALSPHSPNWSAAVASDGGSANSGIPNGRLWLRNFSGPARYPLHITG